MLQTLIAQVQQQAQQVQQAAPQAADAAAQAVQAEGEQGFIHFLVYFFKMGGWPMIPIALTLVFGVAVAVDRIIRIYSVYSIDAESFFSKIQKFVLENSVDRAINLCNAKSGALLPNVLKAGLMRAEGSEQEIQSSVDEATLETMPLVDKRSLYLPLVSNVSTLCGLFGTIVGLIEAFASLDAAAPDQRAKMLAGSIAVAMHATAFGLVVAIPAMVVHTFIQNRANKIIADIDHYGAKLVNLLVTSKRHHR